MSSVQFWRMLRKTFMKLYCIRSLFQKWLNKYFDSIMPHCNRRDDWKQKARRTVASEPGWRIGLSKNNQPKISMCHHDRNWIYLMVLECLVTVHKSWSYLLWYVEKPDMGFWERSDFSADDSQQQRKKIRKIGSSFFQHLAFFLS